MTNWQWPVPIGPVQQPFIPGRHFGVDLYAPTGTPDTASKAGVVAFAGWDSGGFGNLVTIDHGDGSLSLYGHHEAVTVLTGETVAQGVLIGYTDNTGDSRGPHLHFGIRLLGIWVDPLPLLGGSPPSLPPGAPGNGDTVLPPLTRPPPGRCSLPALGLKL